MVELYLLDTNPVIDFFNKKLPKEGRNLLTGIEPAISVITYIELFSNKNISKEETNHLLDFIKIAVVYELRKEIVEKLFFCGKTLKSKLLTLLLPLLH